MKSFYCFIVFLFAVQFSFGQGLRGIEPNSSTSIFKSANSVLLPQSTKHLNLKSVAFGDVDRFDSNNWFYYDDGTNSDAIGGPPEIYWAIRLNIDSTSSRDGYSISKIAIHPYDELYTVPDKPTPFKLMIWEGDNAATLVYEQEVTVYAASEWNEITLDSVHIIDGTKELWVGAYSQGGENYPAGCDSGPAVAGYGDMISLDGNNWESMADNFDFDYNWNLKIYFEVVEAQNPPIVRHPIPDQVLNAGDKLKVVLNGQTEGVFKDKDGNLSYTIFANGTEELPSWISLAADTVIFAPAIADTGCVTIVVQAHNLNGLTASDTIQFCVEGYPVGIENIDRDKLDVMMYPNPAQGKIVLDIQSFMPGNVDVRIMTLSGQTIYHNNFGDEQKIELDLTDKVSGVYLVILKTEGKQIVKKLVLDRK